MFLIASCASVTRASAVINSVPDHHHIWTVSPELLQQATAFLISAVLPATCTDPVLFFHHNSACCWTDPLPVVFFFYHISACCLNCPICISDYFPARHQSLPISVDNCTPGITGTMFTLCSASCTSYVSKHSIPGGIHLPIG